MKNVLFALLWLLSFTTVFGQPTVKPVLTLSDITRPVAGKDLVVTLPPGVSPPVVLVPSTPQRITEVQKINNYFKSLPAWGVLHPAQATSKTKVGADAYTNEIYPDNKTVTGQQKYSCNTTKYTLKTSPDKIVIMEPDVSILYIGALLQGNGISGGLGSLAEFPVRKRSPFAIFTNIPGHGKYKVVTNPNAANVKTAIAELINDVAANQIPTAGSMYYNSHVSSSIEESLLSMGLSANFMGAKATGSFQSTKQANKNTATFYFVQKAFSVGMVTPSTPADFFNAQFTYSDLQDQVNQGTIGPNNIPVYVSGITYGKILMFTVTSTSSVDSIKAAVSASYKDYFSGSLDYKYKQILQSSEVEVVALGGDEEEARRLIQTGNLMAFFEKKTSVQSMVPIFYQFTNILDRQPARFVETTTYNLKECTPLPNSQIDLGDYAQIQILGIKALSDCDYGPLDDHKADLFGEITVEGMLIWKEEEHKRNDLPDLGKGQIFTLPYSRPLPIIDRNSQTQQGKAFVKDTDAFHVYGLLGDWEPLGQFDLMEAFDEQILFSDFKNTYGQERTIYLRGREGKCNMEIKYVITKTGDIIEWKP